MTERKGARLLTGGSGDESDAGSIPAPSVPSRRWLFRRERDPYTRAISLVVSRGFGTTIRLTLWWWSITWHRRDLDLERRIRAEIDVLEAARLNQQKAHAGGALDV